MSATTRQQGKSYYQRGTYLALELNFECNEYVSADQRSVFAAPDPMGYLLALRLWQQEGWVRVPDTFFKDKSDDLFLAVEWLKTNCLGDVMYDAEYFVFKHERDAMMF